MKETDEERKGIQMMKKRFAAMMTVAVLSGAMAVTSLAEGPAADTGMQMSGPQMPGQPPQMGQAPQTSENSQAPQTGENGEAPQTSENSQAPQTGARRDGPGRKHGKRRPPRELRVHQV